MTAPAEAAWLRRLKSYKAERGILRFCDEQFQVQLDAGQERALLAFEDPRPSMRRISMQACAGPGKSAVEAWAAWWFLGCKGEIGEHPKGFATAITGENLKDNLWAELSKWQQRSPYLRSQFTWTASRVFANAHPTTWFLSARSWPKTADAEQQGKTFSGLHGKYVLALVDESGAIPTTVLRAAEQALSTAVFAKLLQGGNPISLEGMLFAAANELRGQWVVIRITGDPDDPEAWVHAPRLAERHVASGECGCPVCWARQQIATYGRDNPWVKAYILGEFPPSSINTLLTLQQVEAAMARTYQPSAYERIQLRLGADIARFGDDRTVLFPRQGLWSWKPRVLRGADTAEIAAHIANWHADVNFDLIFVDDTGHWGHGVVDQLNVAGIPFVALNYAAKALDNRYKNRRAEMWLKGAKAIRTGARLPNVPDLVAELTTPTYTFAGGQFLLEEKDSIKKRLGRSPDLADAYMQTYATEDQPRMFDLLATAAARGRAPGKVKTDFDPFA